MAIDKAKQQEKLDKRAAALRANLKKRAPIKKKKEENKDK